MFFPISFKSYWDRTQQNLSPYPRFLAYYKVFVLTSILQADFCSEDIGKTVSQTGKWGEKHPISLFYIYGLSQFKLSNFSNAEPDTLQLIKLCCEEEHKTGGYK